VLAIHRSADKLCFQVRVQPRASKDEVAGLLQGALKIRLTSPPVDNRANRHLTKFLASILGVPGASIKILSGEKSRLKTIGVEGLEESKLRQRLAQYLV